MRDLFSWHRFDALLRGQLDAAERLRFPLSWLAWQVVAAALFGASLGVYAVTSRALPDPRYMLVGAVKVPLLLLFTSGITIPSLYVFGALAGLRFGARELAAQLMVAHTVLAAVLASLAPVLAFFALTTSSYSFMVLLDVLACATAGFFGVRVFLRALEEPDPRRAEAVPVVDEPPRVAEALVGAETGALPVVVDEGGVVKPVARRPVAPPAVPKSPRELLRSWLALYAFVGVQAGWILRPFIGRPELEFVIFRPKEGGFFGAVWYHFWRMLTGE